MIQIALVLKNPAGDSCVSCLVQAVKSAAVAASEVTKLNYRILHLTRSLREEKQKGAAN